MTEPVFFFDAGELWHRDCRWSRDDMERQARHFERLPSMGLWASYAKEMAAECRQALTDYDAFYAENEDGQLRYETEMAR